MQILQSDYYKEHYDAGYFFARFAHSVLLEDFDVWDAFKVFLVVG
jgi:hypothetical protein